MSHFILPFCIKMNHTIHIATQTEVSFETVIEINENFILLHIYLHSV